MLLQGQCCILACVDEHGPCCSTKDDTHVVISRLTSRRCSMCEVSLYLSEELLCSIYMCNGNCRIVYQASSVWVRLGTEPFHVLHVNTLNSVARLGRSGNDGWAHCQSIPAMLLGYPLRLKLLPVLSEIQLAGQDKRIDRCISCWLRSARLTPATVPVHPAVKYCACEILCQ